MTSPAPAFEIPLRIVYQHPPHSLTFVCIIHVGAIICIFLSGLPALTTLLLVISTFIFMLYLAVSQLKRIIEYPPPELVLDSKDRWSMVGADSSTQRLSLTNASILTNSLLVLRFRTTAVDDHISFILSRRYVDDDTLRRVRIRLLHPLVPANTPGR